MSEIDHKKAEKLAREMLYHLREGDYSNWYGAMDIEDNAKEILDAYLDLLERQRWIPVSERLPEEHSFSWCWLQTDGFLGIFTKGSSLMKILIYVMSPTGGLSPIRRKARRAMLIKDMSLRELQLRYKQIAEKRGFNDADLKDYTLLMVEEVGELSRAVTTSEGVKRLRPGQVNIGEELADIVNYCLIVAIVCDLELQNEVVKKMDKLDQPESEVSDETISDS